MIEALFNQPNYVGAKKMLEASVIRHEAIAGNIANLEQPNYKRVDLAPSFQRELKRAIGSRDSQQIAGLKPQVTVDAQAVASTKDGNSVHLEQELAQLSQNYVLSAVESQLVTGNLLRLRLAITGRSA